MAFLDNSGDIILDAVLTDTGRFRLAKGDGSFNVRFFAVGDDEINYTLYNKNHASGSAYYDLEIMQTPVFEAFTNNTSTMNSKLLSIPNARLLYLPTIKINDKLVNNSSTNSNNSGFAVAVTNDTYKNINSGSSPVGVMNGEIPGPDQKIRLDQGLDTDFFSWTFNIDIDLKETQYIVEIDSRLGSISDAVSFTSPRPSFIDDDSIASYYLSTGNGDFIKDVTARNPGAWNAPVTNNLPSIAVIKGPQGTSLEFVIRSSLELMSSDFLFDRLGGTFTQAQEIAWQLDTTKAYKFIDTIVRVSGATTGYKVNIPVRFIKCTDC